MANTQRPYDPDTEAAQRALVHGVYLTVIGNLLMLAVLLTLAAPVMLQVLLLGHAVLAAGIFFLLRARPALTVLGINAIDAALIVPYLGSIWVAQGVPTLAAFDHLFAPKLLAFGWAMVVPLSYRLHVALIVGLGLESLAIWYRQTAMGAALPATEPWFTILTFWMALSLLVLRIKQRNIDHQVVELRTRTAVLTEIAVLFLRVRDLANSPLQKITLASELLERGQPASAEVIAGLRQSVVEIQALHAQFQRYEQFVPWNATHLTLETDAANPPAK